MAWQASLAQLEQLLDRPSASLLSPIADSRPVSRHQPNQPAVATTVAAAAAPPASPSTPPKREAPASPAVACWAPLGASALELLTCAGWVPPLQGGEPESGALDALLQHEAQRIADGLAPPSGPITAPFPFSSSTVGAVASAHAGAPAALCAELLGVAAAARQAAAQVALLKRLLERTRAESTAAQAALAARVQAQDGALESLAAARDALAVERDALVAEAAAARRASAGRDNEPAAEREREAAATAVALSHLSVLVRTQQQQQQQQQRTAAARGVFVTASSPSLQPSGIAGEPGGAASKIRAAQAPPPPPPLGAGDSSGAMVTTPVRLASVSRPHKTAQSSALSGGIPSSELPQSLHLMSASVAAPPALSATSAFPPPPTRPLVPSAPLVGRSDEAAAAPLLSTLGDRLPPLSATAAAAAAQHPLALIEGASIRRSPRRLQPIVAAAHRPAAAQPEDALAATTTTGSGAAALVSVGLPPRDGDALAAALSALGDGTAAQLVEGSVGRAAAAAVSSCVSATGEFSLSPPPPSSAERPVLEVPADAAHAHGAAAQEAAPSRSPRYLSPTRASANRDRSPSSVAAPAAGGVATPRATRPPMRTSPHSRGALTFNASLAQLLSGGDRRRGARQRPMSALALLCGAAGGELSPSASLRGGARSARDAPSTAGSPRASRLPVHVASTMAAPASPAVASTAATMLSERRSPTMPSEEPSPRSATAAHPSAPHSERGSQPRRSLPRGRPPPVLAAPPTRRSPSRVSTPRDSPPHAAFRHADAVSSGPGGAAPAGHAAAGSAATGSPMAVQLLAAARARIAPNPPPAPQDMARRRLRERALERAEGSLAHRLFARKLHRGAAGGGGAPARGAGSNGVVLA